MEEETMGSAAWRAAPCHLVALAEIYALPEGPKSVGAVEDLLQVELAEIREGRLVVAPRGEAWLQMLLATPLPEARWVDPRKWQTVPCTDPTGSAEFTAARPASH